MSRQFEYSFNCGNRYVTNDLPGCLFTSEMEAKKVESPVPEFDWVELHNEVSGPLPFDESSKEKLLRKIKENPMVPIGCMATVGALSYGLWSFRQGNRRMSQYMMRMRIFAQGFTLLALVAGIGMAATKS